MNAKACYLFIFAVVVIFVDSTSLNSFWQVLVALSFAFSLFPKPGGNCPSLPPPGQ